MLKIRYIVIILILILTNNSLAYDYSFKNKNYEFSVCMSGVEGFFQDFADFSLDFLIKLRAGVRISNCFQEI